MLILCEIKSTLYPALFINNPCAGDKVLDYGWPIKTHYPRSKVLESRQINISKTNFRAFRQCLQSNKRQVIILQRNYFSRKPDSWQEVHSHKNKMAQVKPESKEILLTFQFRIV